MIEIPEKIRELRFKKLEVEKIAVERTKTLEKIKAKIASEALCVTGEDNKKLYTNDASRRAAIESSLSVDSTYQEALLNLQLASEEVKKLDIELEYQYNMFKIHLAKNCPF